MNEPVLINLAPQIKEAYEEAARLAADAKSYACDAVAKAAECGRLLLEQKASLGHGSWLEWVAQNLPNISYPTLSRYMRVAKAAPRGDADPNLSHVINLGNASTIRSAYLALGILPSPPEKDDSAPDPDKPWVRYVRFLDGFRKWFNVRIEEDPLDGWPENARRVLKNDLRWFAELYARL